MSYVERGECETQYHEDVKCYRFFCRRKPTNRKLIIKFPFIPRYVPACDKHK